MKPLKSRSLICALVFTTFCFMCVNSWARLPKPIEASGVILAVDADTQTLVFKAAKDKKPFVLDWNKDTQFIRNGQAATAAELTNGAAVVIHYKDVSFRNPLLKRVIWNERVSGP